jgi:hypothetical protein
MGTTSIEILSIPDGLPARGFGFKDQRPANIGDLDVRILYQVGNGDRTGITGPHRVWINISRIIIRNGRLDFILKGDNSFLSAEKHITGTVECYAGDGIGKQGAVFFRKMINLFLSIC